MLLVLVVLLSLVVIIIIIIITVILSIIVAIIIISRCIACLSEPVCVAKESIVYPRRPSAVCM